MDKPGAVVEKFLGCLSKTSKRRILSYGSSRAEGGGAERSWGAGEVLERSVVKVVDERITCSIQEVYISQGGFGSTDT